MNPMPRLSCTTWRPIPTRPRIWPSAIHSAWQCCAACSTPGGTRPSSGAELLGQFLNSNVAPANLTRFLFGADTVHLQCDDPFRRHAVGQIGCRYAVEPGLDQI